MGIFKRPEEALFDLGTPSIDAPLRGGLERAAVHEILAEAGHAASAIGFSLALSLRALGQNGGAVWLRQDSGIAEAGLAYGPGLVELGFSPERLALVRLRTATDSLRAGIEAARCSAIGALVLELSDAGHKADLTATRRLKLAAEKSGVTIFLVRAENQATPSGAQTRWLVRPARSRTVAEHGPGRPHFDITLLRHRAGLAGARWHVEWNRDRRTFETALSQPVVSVSASRPMAA